MCGLLYELLHFKYGDATNRLHSLDIEWQHYYRKLQTFRPIEEDPDMVKRMGTTNFYKIQFQDLELTGIPWLWQQHPEVGGSAQ